MSPLKNIDDCFERGLLRRVEPSRTKSEQSLLQAGEWLSEAEKNLEAGALRSAVSSAYLAVFHSARAVLFRDGVREKSHYCIGLNEHASSVLCAPGILASFLCSLLAVDAERQD